MTHDRFGNPYAPGLPYARGGILPGTRDDVTKLREAWRLIDSRIAEAGSGSVFNFSGLERQMSVRPEDEGMLDDEVAPALFGDKLRQLGLEHMGADPARHDVMLMNRQTAALLCAMLVMAQPGDTVIGISPSYSHPAVVRAARRARAQFRDTTSLAEFKATMESAQSVSVVALTRLAVTYDIMSASDIAEVVRIAHDHGARVLVDDAGGARVGPAVFDQPKSMELGVDVASTGLDKYGTLGPRVGLLAGSNDLVAEIRALAFELGAEARPMLYPATVRALEQYRPERVRELVTTTKSVAAALKAKLGNRVAETPVTAQLHAEDILEIAMERGGVSEAPAVPYEATAALSQILLRDHGIMTVHLAGLPPGTAALLIKFVPPETLERFGGTDRFVEAIDSALSTLSSLIGDEVALRNLLRGCETPLAAEAAP